MKSAHESPRREPGSAAPRNWRSRGVAATALVMLGAVPSHAQTAARGQLDWVAIADKLTRQLALETDEKVLLLAYPGMFDDLIEPLRAAVTAAGGIDLGVLMVRPRPPSSPDRRESVRVAYRRMFQDVDAAVMLPGATPGRPAYDALQDLLHEGHGRTVHFHWLENGRVFPVAGQPLPPLRVIDTVYQRALLETDYEALARVQARFEETMRNAEVRVTSPAGTDLRFEIGDRPVNRQDGDASAARAARGRILIDREIELPAGAVRVAPVEESVHGTIVFPISQWAGRPVTELRLRVEAGRVIEIDASAGEEHVEREMSGAGDAGRSFREFALGFNPLLAVPAESPWVPYYGYGAGVVRLSLGDNSELGGRVTGGYVRWNFFTDTTVRIGDTVWVRDGRLQPPS